MRDPKIFVIIGGRGSGKTYYLEHKLQPSQTVVFEDALTNRWEGYEKHYVEDFEANKIGYKQIGNKKVVFEDATAYINSNLKDTYKKMLVHSKQVGCDVYMIFHTPNKVPPFVWDMANYIIMFKCKPIRKTAHNADYYDEIVKNWKLLQKKKPYSYAVIETDA